MTGPDNHLPVPHESALLLPWYVSATLAERERLEVAAHLRVCAECRAELESVLMTREQMRGLFADEPMPEQSMHEAVMTSVRLVSPDRSERSTSAGFQVHGRPYTHRGPLLACADALRTLLRPRWAPALAVMLVMLQAGTIVWLSIPDTTRDGVATRAVAPPEATRIRVVFYPRAAEQDIRTALRALGGRIVDGPTANGGYIIELPPEDPLTLSRKIRALRERSGLVQQMELVPQASHAPP
jgi:anti-sigma factor RsiW